jgi:hypothetical protein
MSQGIFGTIVPTTTSGNQLASILNDFKEAVVSGFSGTSRPSELDAGGYWIDTSNANLWAYKMYTGVQDVTIFTLNLSTGTSSISAADSSFEIAKSTADSIGPVLKLIKERLANNGQTLEGDTLGEVQFYATRDSGVNVVSARIKAISTDDTTASVQGSYLTFDISADATNSLVEAMRLIDGKLGIGLTAPQEKLHVKGNGKFEVESDDTVGAKVYLKKKRIANSGQVLNGDVVGNVEFISNDSNLADATSAAIEVSARENHTASAHGSKISIKNKKLGQTTYTEQIAIEESVTVKTNLIVDGDFTVNGDSITINTSDLQVEDSNILVNKGGTQATANTNKAGLTVDISDGTDAILGYNSTKASKFVMGQVGSESEVITADAIQALTNKTLTSPSIVTPTRLDAKQGIESALITYALNAANGQFCFATDTKVMYQVVDGEIVPVGSGGGGISLSWVKDTNGPVSEFVDGFKLECFDNISSQEIYAVLSVPSSYRAGKPIKLKGGKFFCASVAGKVFFKAQSALINSNTVLGTYTNVRTSTNLEVTVPGVSNQIASVGDLDLTDSLGKINSVAVAAGDKIRIKIFRGNASESSSASEDAKIVLDAFEPTFS